MRREGIDALDIDVAARRFLTSIEHLGGSSARAAPSVTSLPIEHAGIAAGSAERQLARRAAKWFISQLTVWFGSLAPVIVVRSWLVSLTPADVTNPG
jgi:hypothetical protein